MRQNISSGTPWEPIVGYSRAVVVDRHVFVAGCAPIMPDDADPPRDAYAQTRRCLEIIEAALREAGGGDIPVVAGGIIPEADAEALKAAGVAAVYTPKDFEITRILRGIVAIVADRHGVRSAA